MDFFVDRLFCDNVGLLDEFRIFFYKFIYYNFILSLLLIVELIFIDFEKYCNEIFEGFG